MTSYLDHGPLYEYSIIMHRVLGLFDIPTDAYGIVVVIHILESANESIFIKTKAKVPIHSFSVVLHSMFQSLIECSLYINILRMLLAQIRYLSAVFRSQSIDFLFLFVQPHSLLFF